MSNFILCCSSHFATVMPHSGKPLNEGPLIETENQSLATGFRL
jgi:hypothetical protein